MLQVSVRGGGSGRYHSRAVMPPPRAAPAASAVAAAPEVAVGAIGGASGVISGPPRPPARLRRIVFAPPLPKVSYMRSMPLWFELIKPRYPGDHMSTNACVHTPGMP